MPSRNATGDGFLHVRPSRSSGDADRIASVVNRRCAGTIEDDDDNDESK